MQNYESARGLSKLCNATPETITRLAAELRVGTAGPHKNSPRVFRPDEGARVMEAFFNEKIGHARNETMLAKGEIVRTAENMARLASLAAGMGHPAAAELRELGAVVAKIRAGSPKADLKSLDGRARFLNACNPYFQQLTAQLKTTIAKI